MKDFFQVFNEAKQKYFIGLRDEYEHAIQLAREKVMVYRGYYDTVLRAKFNEVRTRLGTNSNLYPEMIEIYKRDSRIELNEIFNDKIESIDIKIREKVLDNLAYSEALNQMFEFWRREETKFEIDKEIISNKSDVKWVKENETEFVQFAYSLFYAGYVKSSEGGITKFVEYMAKIFDFPLGKNWHSNFSKSIHNTKAGYEPAFVKNLRQAYFEFSSKKLNKNR